MEILGVHIEGHGVSVDGPVDDGAMDLRGRQGAFIVIGCSYLGAASANPMGCPRRLVTAVAATAENAA